MKNTKIECRHAPQFSLYNMKSEIQTCKKCGKRIKTNRIITAFSIPLIMALTYAIMYLIGLFPLFYTKPIVFFIVYLIVGIVLITVSYYYVLPFREVDSDPTRAKSENEKNISNNSD